MSVQITNVTITPSETTVGQPITVTIVAREIMWQHLAEDFPSWNMVKHSFASWNKVKNYIYSDPGGTPDNDCVYCCNGCALFDTNIDQISISGGATLAHPAATVDWFVGEVKNG